MLGEVVEFELEMDLRVIREIVAGRDMIVHTDGQCEEDEAEDGADDAETDEDPHCGRGGK